MLLDDLGLKFQDRFHQLDENIIMTIIILLKVPLDIANYPLRPLIYHQRHLQHGEFEQPFKLVETFGCCLLDESEEADRGRVF
jgi:hypothetical protein